MMAKRMAVLAALAMALLSGGAGCYKNIAPMPGVLPATGLLFKSELTPLSGHFRLAQCEILESPYSNTFYPFNVASAKPSDRLITKLDKSAGASWEFADYVTIRRFKGRQSPNLSNDGRKIIYMRPEISSGESAYPRAYPVDKRTYRVVVLDNQLGKRYQLGTFCRVYGLGWASFWSADNTSIAFTTRCAAQRGLEMELVVTDGFGNPKLMSTTLPAMAGLEFISWSPKGNYLAALRPVNPDTNGSGGGMVIEIDVDNALFREVGPITPTAASYNADHFERLVVWGDNGRCQVRQ